MAWRQFSARTPFIEGVQYLREVHAPKRTGTDIASLIEHTHKWQGYQEALNDLTEYLASIPKVEKSIDEPNLNA